LEFEGGEESRVLVLEYDFIPGVGMEEHVHGAQGTALPWYSFAAYIMIQGGVLDNRWLVEST
jgi:hypothetical protein